jgi:hypothetical protein
MSNKTPKTATKAAPSAVKTPAATMNGNGNASHKKTPMTKTLPVSNKKKPEEEAEESSENDEDDEEEIEAFAKKGKTVPTKKTADPEDEDEEGADEEMDDEDEEGDDYPSEIFDVAERLTFGPQVGIHVSNDVLVRGAQIGGRTYPLHISNVCLGPDAAKGDRGSLAIIRYPSMLPWNNHDHDHEHDHEHEHDDEPEQDEEEEEDEEDEDEAGLDDDYDEMVLATLSRDVAENAPLDVVIEGDFLLINTCKESDMYVTARVMLDEGDDDEYDEDYEEEEEEDDEDDEDDIEEDEDENEESRMDLDDEDDEEEEDDAAAAARAKEVRKRLLGNGPSSSEPESKKTKVAPTPKVIDPKQAQKKPAESAAKAASAGNAKAKATVDSVKDFVISKLKEKQTIKNTDLGTMIVEQFGNSFKNLGFEEKNVTKFMEKYASDKVEVASDSIKYKSK